MRWLPAIVVVGAGLVAFGAAGLFGRAPKVSGEALLGDPPDVGIPNLRTVGVGGCASSGCHGGSATASLSGKWDDRTWAGSATHWFAVDPHTKAYAALQSPLAASIMTGMHSALAATEDLRCVACHTNPSLANANADPRERSLRADGVSCEACHGDAGKWLHSHTSWTEANRAASYDQTAMTKLFDIGERAVACAGCHVGAAADESRGIPVRDMNHDMIAAGHPRLNFDFADFQRRLPHHWKEADTSPEFEVKSWLVGRAAHSDAAAKLTADREQRGKAGFAPWPEFAEWNCVSCHHPIGDKFPGTTGKPSYPTNWPANLNRVKLSSASGAECQIAMDAALKSVDVAKLDRDTAGQVYFGLAARERARMKRGGLANYDPAFDRLANLLSLPRGNLDFKMSPDVRNELSGLLMK